jgi:hypothetical protein
VTRIVALVDDLMDRSRLLAAVPAAEAIRDANGAVGADVVIVDVARHGDAVSEVRRVAPRARIIAFGPHVDDHRLAGRVFQARMWFCRDHGSSGIRWRRWRMRLRVDTRDGQVPAWLSAAGREGDP